jgi:hypothetical protein
VVEKPAVEHSVKSSVVRGDEQVIDGEYRTVILRRDIIASSRAVLAVLVVENVKEDEAAVLSSCTAASSLTDLRYSIS